MDLIEMYPAAVNSKVTVTLGVLNADSTIIEVLDGSVLPDAPNLLVLGSDQTAETVKLTAKEGNTLTVERGIQGNAIAWPAGTQVARNFTAKDWDDLVANVATIVTKIMGLNAADVGALSDTTKQIDIGARPNANLLHNWYFGNPVNRNGLSEFTQATAVTIDRWRKAGVQGTVRVVDGGILLDNTLGTSAMYFGQFLAMSDFIGKVVTFSFVDGDNNLYSTSGKITDNESWQLTKNFGIGEIYIQYHANYTSWGAYFTIATGNSIKIIACKLELGDTQTLAHQENGVWVLNEIPDYAEQMAICQQYNATTGAYIGGSLPLDGNVSMIGASLELYNKYASIYANENQIRLMTRNVAGDNTTRRQLILQNSNIGELLGCLHLNDTETAKNYMVHGEHNKPSGSYTGNGSATKRTIQTGAIGNWVGINGTYGTMAVLNPKGGWYKEGTSIVAFGVDVGYAADGNIYLSSEKVQLNGNGYEYVYTWF